MMVLDRDVMEEEENIGMYREKKEKRGKEG